VQWHQLSESYQFTQYESHFYKVYGSEMERAQRNIIFSERLREILDHNADETKSWKLTVNRFTDHTQEELNSFLGLNKAQLVQRKSLVTSKPDFPKVNVSDLPTEVDWRRKGVITAVKDQGQCGSCWAFASTESIESAWALATGKLLELSPQNILDCTPNPNHCGGTGGCGGATGELAFDMVKQYGISLESVYPYRSYNGNDFPCSRKATAASITGYVNLPENEYDPIMNALANVGPMAISVDAASWFAYGGGVYDGCNQVNPDLDHLVQLVGYGSDSKLGDYWLVRNSWSDSWGEDGYIRLRRSSDLRCGTDSKPQDGDGCDGGPPTIKVCGTCGILYDAVYPEYKK
jgi:cathepsin L